MKSLGLLSLIVATFVQFSAQADDLMASRSLKFSSPDPSAAAEAVLADLPGLFRAYQPVLDSGSTLVEGWKVSGSANHPILTMTVRKCALVVLCQAVTFDGQVNLSQVQGKCQLNYQVETDLSQSSDNMRAVYDRLETYLCLNTTGNTGNLQLTSYAHRASSYMAGPVQQAIFGFLQMQTDPLLVAIKTKLANH